MKRIVFLLAAAFFLAGTAQADIIAYTSFEEIGLGSQYTDTGDASTDHDLANNYGEMQVNYYPVLGAKELGFSSRYVSTGGDGLTDGDYVGVTDDTPVYGVSFTDGTQGFEMQDTDGIMISSLESVDLAGYTNVIVSMDLFVEETGWEGDEGIRAYVTVNGGDELDLINTYGYDVDDLAIEDSWMTLTLDLTGYTTADLSFLLEANAADEAIWVDSIVFEGTPVPVPAAVWMLGTGLIGLVGWRRRMG